MDNSGLIADALLKTDPGLAGSIDSANAWKNELIEQGARVSLYRRYEEGDHRSGITDQMRNMLRLRVDDSNITDFNDNYCRIIIDKMTGRLATTEIKTGQDNIDTGWITPLLDLNSWKALQGTVYQGAIRDGKSFVMVDPKTLRWSSEPAFDGFDGVVILTDGFSRNPIWGCKLWSETIEGSGMDSETSTMRLVVYQPDRITYWFGEEGGEEVQPDNRMEGAVTELRDTGTGLSEVIEVQVQTNELPWPVGKVPIIPFINQYNNYSSEGKSEIRPAIPLQDVLNRTLHSMVMASEFAAFRIKWSIGMAIDATGITPGAVINLVLKDATGNIITEMDEQTVEFMKAVKVGQFDETDISQYIQQIDKLAREISQISQTPIYGVTTEGVLSGEALKQLEIGLITKVERFQAENTDAIRDLIQLTALIQSKFLTESTLPAIPEGSLLKLTVTWKPAELLDVNAQVTVLITMRKDAPGLWDDDWYRGRIGGLLGMSPSDIATEGAKAQQQQQNSLESLVGAGGDTQPVVQ